MALIDTRPAPLDRGALREALGAFTTGVTIVSTQDATGQDVGVTANSFNSVSLDPPMVLWSLSRKALSLAAFRSNPYFAVHVLAADQHGLSRLFATQGADKFAGLAVERGQGNVPLIDHCTARFQCRTAFDYDGGDHVIFVGEVLQFDSLQRPPLLFHGGRYAVATSKDAPHGPITHMRVETAADAEHEFLFGLLGLAHNTLYDHIQAQLGKGNLSASERSSLSLLGVSADARPDETIEHLVTAARSAEATAAAHLGAEELALLKRLLRKLMGER